MANYIIQGYSYIIKANGDNGVYQNPTIFARVALIFLAGASAAG
jgi:hypothetical protein